MKAAIICIGKCRCKELINDMIKIPLREFIIETHDRNTIVNLIGKLLKDGYRIIIFDHIEPEAYMEIALKYKGNGIFIILPCIYK